MKLDNINTLYKEEKRQGCIITLDYTRYYSKPDYRHYMMEMLLVLTNWKSNNDFVVDFQTFYGTNRIEIVFDCDVEKAKNFIGYFNYYDHKNIYSPEENKDFILLDIWNVIEKVAIFELYNDNTEYEEIGIIIKQV